jgi:TolB-like protein
VCVNERRRLGLTREALSTSSAGPHPLSVTTIKRAEQGQPIYVASAARLAELLNVQLSTLVGRDQLIDEVNASELPTLRVHRFRCLDTDDTNSVAADALCLGLTDDLLRRLSSRCFPVIAVLADPSRHDSVAVRASSYDLNGSVVRSGGMLRVGVRLTCGHEQRVIWADNFQRSVGNIFALQDELTRVVVAHVTAKVLESESEARRPLEGGQLTAWEQSLMGRWAFRQYNRQSNANARALMTESLKQSRSVPIAWYTLALTHQRDLLNQWSDNLEHSLRELVRLSEEFDREFQDDAYAHIVGGYRNIYTGQRQRAAARVREAIDIDPNIAIAYGLLGQILAMAGDWERAIEDLELSLSLAEDPNERWPAYVGLALSYFVGERYEDCVAWGERAVATRSGATFAYCTMASAHALQGDTARAKAAWSMVEQLGSNVAERALGPLLQTTEPAIAQRYVEGLRRAGLHS